MASSKDYLQFVLEQLSELQEICMDQPYAEVTPIYDKNEPTSARNLFDDGVQGVESLIDLVHYLLALVDHFGDLFRAGLRQRINRRLDALQDRTGVGQVLLDGSDFGNGKRAVGEVHAGQQLFDIEVHQRALRGTVDLRQGVGRGVGGDVHHVF